MPSRNEDAAKPPSSDLEDPTQDLLATQPQPERLTSTSAHQEKGARNPGDSHNL